MLIVLASYAGKDRQAEVGRRTLMRRLDIHGRDFDRFMGELVERRYVVPEKKPGRRTVYQILHDALAGHVPASQPAGHVPATRPDELAGKIGSNWPGKSTPTGRAIPGHVQIQQKNRGDEPRGPAVAGPTGSAPSEGVPMPPDVLERSRRLRGAATTAAHPSETEGETGPTLEKVVDAMRAEGQP
jgi:hypothetical protein